MNTKEHPQVLWNDFGDDSWVCNSCGQSGSSALGFRPEDIFCSRRLTEETLQTLEKEEDFLRHYDLKNYPPVGVTVDLAIFTIIDNEFSLLLVKRTTHPEKEKWALPGGFIDATSNDSLDKTAARKLKEETGLTVGESHIEQLQTVGNLKRDPRGFIVSVSYVALAPHLKTPKNNNEVAFVPVKDILAKKYALAFDHSEIILAGIERVRAKLEYAPIAHKFLTTDEFTISEIRKVYEAVLGEEMNPSNFRRKVKSVPGMLIPTGDKRNSKLDGGRPSLTYKAGNIKYIYPPLRLLKDF